MILLFLLSCSLVAPWKYTRVGVEGLHVNSITAWNKDLALIGGEDGDHNGIILAYDGHALRETFFQKESEVSAITHRGTRAWAVVRTGSRPADRLLKLYRSETEGRDWVYLSSIPFNSVYQIVATSDSALWALGHNLLAKSVDGGLSWTALESPTHRNGFFERIDLLPNSIAILGKKGYRSTDDGLHWRPIGVSGEIVDFSGAAQLKLENKRSFFRQDEHSPWEALPVNAGDEPIALRVDGPNTTVIVGAPSGPNQHFITVYKRKNTGKWRYYSSFAERFPPVWTIADDGSVFGPSMTGWWLAVLPP